MWAGSADVYSDERGTIGRIRKLKDGRWSWRLVFGVGQGHAESRAAAIRAVLATPAAPKVQPGHSPDCGACLNRPGDGARRMYHTMELPPQKPLVPGPVDELHRAVVEVNRDHPLPRCEHDQALRDHSGEKLEPPCGCRAPEKDWIISLRDPVGNATLQQLVFDHDEHGVDVVVIRDLRFGSEGRAVVTRTETGAKEMLEHLRRPVTPPPAVVKKGDTVRMSESLKDRMRENGSTAHVHEFGLSVGVVQGFTDYNNRGEPLDVSRIGPEVDVRWEPSKLRYAYHPGDLEVVK